MPSSQYLEQIRSAWKAMEPWMKKGFVDAVLKYSPPDFTGDDYSGGKKTYHDQKITRFEVKQGTVVDSPARPNNIKLRIEFRVLEVSGMVAWGAFEGDQRPTYTHTVSDGTLDWDADPGPPLTITELSVAGDQSVNVDTSRCQWSGWLGDQNRYIREELQDKANVFKSNKFLFALTAILNRKMLEVMP